MHSDYLERILTARVYDVAHETPLEYAPNLSARLNNQLLLKMNETLTGICGGVMNSRGRSKPTAQGLPERGGSVIYSLNGVYCTILQKTLHLYNKQYRFVPNENYFF